MYKFVTMKKPLQHTVYCGTKVAIPEGTRRVQIAFGASHLVRNTDTGSVYAVDFSIPLEANEKRLNVYRRYRSERLIHA